MCGGSVGRMTELGDAELGHGRIAGKPVRLLPRPDLATAAGVKGLPGLSQLPNRRIPCLAWTHVRYEGYRVTNTRFQVLRGTMDQIGLSS